MIMVPRITGELVRLRQANAATAGGPLAEVPIDVELTVFEQYPPALRCAFNETATKVNCLAFVDHYNWAVRQGFSYEPTLRKLHDMERNEIAVFAGQFRAQHKCDLPHTAAGATVQRYGDLGPSRHPPRRTGKPILQRRARKRRFRNYVPAVIEMSA